MSKDRSRRRRLSRGFMPLCSLVAPNSENPQGSNSEDNHSKSKVKYFDVEENDAGGDKTDAAGDTQENYI